MFRQLVLGTVVLSLTACWSEGDDQSGGFISRSEARGTAAKGIISGATVEARRPDGSLIGRAVTDDDGSYSIEFTDHHGPALLVLKPRDGAMVTCDVAQCRTASPTDDDNDRDGVIEFGERYALDYELRSVIFVEESSTAVDAHITPLTTLVAARAANSMDRAGIYAANSFVKDLLGLDMNPSEVRPIDLTRSGSATDQELRFAMLNAALEQLALGGSIRDVLGEFSGEVAASVVTRQRLQDLVSGIESVEEAVRNGNSLLNVASAASGARYGAASAMERICGESATTTCTPQTGGGEHVGDNLSHARSLVAATRKVSMEALVNLDAELGNEYSDTLIPRIKSASGAIDRDTRKVILALGEVTAVVADQAARTWLSPSYPETPLVDAATLFFQRNRSSGCDWTEWDPAAQVACESDNSAAYLARFVDGVITRSGSAWRAEGAVFDLDGDPASTEDQVTVDVELALPALSGDIANGFGLSAGVNILSINGGASLGGAGDDVSFQLNGGSRLMLELQEPYHPEQDELPLIQRLTLDAETVLVNSRIQFSGGLRFQLRGATRHSQMNGYSALLPVPEKLELYGRFRDRDSDQVVGGRFIFTADNVENFGFYEEGFIREDLANWNHDAGMNSLTVRFGDAANALEVQYSLENGDREAPFYLQAKCMAGKGSAVCPTDQWRIPFRNTWLPASDIGTSTRCATESGLWINGECIVQVQASESGVEDDIRVAFTDSTARQALGDLSMEIPGEGVYRFGPRHWKPFRLDQHADSGQIDARLTESQFEFGPEGRYLKGSLRVETYGKLSPRLPQMDVSVVARRTGYDFGLLTLLLRWGNESLTIRYHVEAKPEDRITLRDGHGTEMTLLFDPDEKSISEGYVTKDGTRYGNVKTENGQIIITWLDNSIETLF